MLCTKGRKKQIGKKLSQINVVPTHRNDLTQFFFVNPQIGNICKD